ncbi:MAG: hypothetical protein ACREKB_14930, partial [Candidatus Rokuibacteriota bacterium]
MHSRLRPHWLALAAAALLVALSVSSAFGADPPDGEDKNHGQQVSDFVHSLLFGDPTSDDEDTSSDEDTAEDEDTSGDDTSDEVEPADEDTQDGEWANHGACVSAVATTHDEVGGPNDTHGWAVSDAARYTCWGEESQAQDAEAEDTEAEDTEAEGHG